MSVFVRYEEPPHYSDYRLYKPHLRRDFHYQCAYCTVHEAEFGGHYNFQIDHFRPQSLFPQLRTEYSNLYYACSICNTYKSNKWPTEEQRQQGYRFLDPCIDDYAAHFEELPDWTLRVLTKPAKYTLVHCRLNRLQLVGLRQMRKEQKRDFVRWIELIKDDLRKTDKLLQINFLPEDVYNTLVQMRENLQQQLLREQDRWENRLTLPY